MINKFSIFFILIIVVSSCVPHKRIVYFQGDSLTENVIKEINSKPYRLQVDDIIKVDIKAPNEEIVSVFRNNSTSQSQQNESSLYFSGYTVDKQGFIQLPYLDKINVLGYTADEVEKKIQTGFSKYFKNTDEIFISVKLAGIKYTIVGEVGSTGSKILFQNTVNIIEAIANAGDIDLTGDKTNVEVIRIGITGVEKFHVDLTQMTVFNSEVFYIQPNDIINVPALKQKTIGTGVTATQTLSTVVSVLSLISTIYLWTKIL
ncbi:MAG TPA: sugar transporter [Lutibacter sp.]|nr:sugar transporter [Lutibacter sp.]